MIAQFQGRDYAHYYRPEFLEQVTLETIGAVSGITKLQTPGDNKQGLRAEALVESIDGVLRAHGTTKDAAGRDMVKFLSSVRGDLDALAGMSHGDEMWSRRVTGLQRTASGPAETLFKRHFQGQRSAVDAYHPAAHVPSAMHTRFVARNAM